jgi:hypothetical protein
MYQADKQMSKSEITSALQESPFWQTLDKEEQETLVAYYTDEATLFEQINAVEVFNDLG